MSNTMTISGESDMVQAQQVLPSKTPASTETAKVVNVSYKYAQVKRLAVLLEDVIETKFWITLSKDEQESEKENPTETAFYRLGFCRYNDIPLLNILRFFPDKTKAFKSKSYATINLNTMKPTSNSQNKPKFDEDVIESIRIILNIDK